MFRVTSAQKSFTLDNYNEGEDPSTTQFVDISPLRNFYESIEDLASDLCLPENKENWYAYDDGVLHCSVAEDENGLTADDNDMEKFKNGEINLWSCVYQFHIEMIEVHTPSEEEMAEKFGIETY